MAKDLPDMAHVGAAFDQVRCERTPYAARKESNLKFQEVLSHVRSARRSRYAVKIRAQAASPPTEAVTPGAYDLASPFGRRDALLISFTYHTALRDRLTGNARASSFTSSRSEAKRYRPGMASPGSISTSPRPSAKAPAVAWCH
jgi:hypothetical protein